MRQARFALALSLFAVLSFIFQGCGDGTSDSTFIDLSHDGSAGGVDGTSGNFGDNDSGGLGTCTAKTCQQLGFECGPQGDGCGGVVQCGDCPNGQFCGGGGPSKCGIGALPDGAPICVAKTCADLGAGCGQQGDGCGAVIDCGACTSPAYCGGGGASQCGQGGPDGGSSCVQKTCADLNATCGQQGDGCGALMDCGTCGAPSYCGGAGANHCGQGGADGGAACTPKTCAQLNATCGMQGDGCGNTVNCGTCNGPDFCGGNGPNHCGQGGFDGGAPCVAKTCGELGATCGTQGDGCGGTVDCGTCATGFCGGNGPNHCGLGGADGGTPCVKKSCTDLGASCGTQGDGCGGTLNCGGCTSPQFCGGAGANKCGLGGADGGAPCVKKSCGQLGASCGTQGDGCGGTLDCGTCTLPQYCGGAGPNKCGQGGADGGSVCAPKTCAALGATCGQQGDGCGGTLNCGTCTSPQYCGGAGPNKCGQGGVDGGSPCVPKSCASLGASCGTQGDGCGSTLNCGTCTAPAFCGGGGTNKCGQGGVDGGSLCTPRTCAQLGVDCGPVGDGCGNLIASCGVCSNGDICGGGGVPSRCGGGGGDGGTPCPLCTKLPACDAAAPTTITGTVVSPRTCLGAVCNAKVNPGDADPIPNALVYIPAGGDAAIVPFTQGVTCDQCAGAGNVAALASVTTGADGKFTLSGNIPAGANIPIVVQLGRWRRVFHITVTACGATVAGDLHLPKNANQGDIPYTALATGGADSLECVLRKMGIDDAEFVRAGTAANLPTTGARIQLYQGDNSVGNGNNDSYGALPKTGAAVNWSNLWGNLNTLKQFDQLIFDCNGDPTVASMGDPDRTRVQQYLEAGGRLFATHYMYVWFATGNAVQNPDQTHTYPGFAPFNATANWHLNQTSVGFTNGVTVLGDLDVSFARGATFATWLNNLGALFNVSPPKIRLDTSRHDLDPFPNPPGTGVYAPAQRWISVDPNNSAGSAFPTTTGGRNPQPITNYVGAPQHYTFNMPWNALPAAQCGRVLFSDFHVYNVSIQNATTRFPSECGAATDALSAQERVLEYMMFDLATCITPDNPPPPPTCTPKNCQQLGATCGSQGDGCGGTISCGTCTAPDTCGGSGVTNKCGHGTCTPITCAAQGLSCGPAGDGCGGTIASCGNCPNGQTCGGGGTPGVCGVGTCNAQTCQSKGITCGPTGDGCGLLLQCGGCTLPDTCGGGGALGHCGHGTCTPSTCTSLGIGCGPAGDGCGGTLDCGACTSPDTCGGAGVTGQCGHVACSPATCQQEGISCGPAGDGCGGAIDCGGCATPAVCGGGGVPSQCGTTACTPLTCAGQGITCGPAGDGCGGTLACGPCTSPDSCGGGGVPGVCGHPTCAPLTCGGQGIQCGPAGNGCGGQLDCGPCASGTCGGGGVPGVCGTGTTCTKSTCSAQGISCGPAGDGCGGVLDCGACTAPDTCGGGGVPGQCGHNTCSKVTCQQQGIDCGPAGDGCGGLLDCGACTGGNTCGGGGIPGVCGHPACVPRTCQQQGISCGPAGDGCGGALDCGTCVSPATCGGGGVPGVCGGTGPLK